MRPERVTTESPINSGDSATQRTEGSHQRMVSLRQVQLNPAILDTLGVTSLAWLAHEAESYEPNGDDITMMHIDSVLSARPRGEYEIFRKEYLRIWPEHARARGYAQANADLRQDADSAASNAK